MGKLKTKVACLSLLFAYLFSSLVSPVFASITYSYDANGNMTSDGTYCYTFNEANQISQVKTCSNNQLIAAYVYDGNGNRLIKKNYVNGTLSSTVYSPEDEYQTKKLASNSATENTTYYFANNEQLAKKNPDGTKNCVHNDHLGSSSVLTNSSATVVENTTYDPWGEVKAGGTQDKFQYTSQEKDSETGLNYYNFRYYNSHIRRFTQPDDILPNPYDPQQLNRYSYVRNNPLTHTDPSGHCPACIIFLAGGLTLSGLEVGGGLYGGITSPDGSLNGRTLNALAGAQNAVDSPIGQIALGVATLGVGIAAENASGPKAVSSLTEETQAEQGALRGAQIPKVQEAIREGLSQHEAFYRMPSRVVCKDHEEESQQRTRRVAVRAEQKRLSKASENG
jgi:RHS repeat-associated protein